MTCPFQPASLIAFAVLALATAPASAAAQRMSVVADGADLLIQIDGAASGAWIFFLALPEGSDDALRRDLLSAIAAGARPALVVRADAAGTYQLSVAADAVDRDPAYAAWVSGEGFEFLGRVGAPAMGVSVASAEVLVNGGGPLLWERLPDTPRPLGEAELAEVGGHLYFFGGIDNNTNGPAHIDRYNLATGAWGTVGQMPLAVHRNHVRLIAHEDLIILCGGKTGNPATTALDTVWAYDTAAATWTQWPSLPGRRYGAPTAKVFHADTGSTWIHLVSGGENNDECSPAHYALDLADVAAGWQTLAPIPQPVVHAGAGSFVLNGVAKLGVVGGETAHNHQGDNEIATLQIYDPPTNTWMLGANCPRRWSHNDWNIEVIQNQLFVFGGVDEDTSPKAIDEILRYVPTTNRWLVQRRMPLPLASPGVTAHGNYLYVAGGGLNDWFGGSMRTFYRSPLSGLADPAHLHLDVMTPGVDVPGGE